ncbi:MAG: hypothetical protein N4A63_02300 [Vallitalea sp.]|jgi:hypothetical protein|nr:hypothetical protein [Vallitalea sp.]
MNENTMMLIQKLNNGEDISKYFQYSNHTLYNLDEASVEAKYIKITQYYRAEINKTNEVKDIARLAVECIAKMTGDKVFERENLKKLELYGGMDIEKNTRKQQKIT